MSVSSGVSIIIVSWNNKNLLARCLTSLQHHVATSHEVIVIDNASTDGTPDLIRTQFPQVKLKVNPTNRGFSAANNQGLQLAQFPFVAFFNNDTEIITDPFPQIFSLFSADKKVGAVGPRLLNADQSYQPSTRRFPHWSDQVLTLLKLRGLLRHSGIMQRYLQPELAHAAVSTPVEEITGAAIIMPRQLCLEIGGWDEGYWIWFEDVDLCHRIADQGYRVVYEPRVTIIHHGGQSFRQVLSLKKHRWFLQSLWRYSQKFWPSFQHWTLAPFMALSYVLTIVQMLVKPR